VIAQSNIPTDSLAQCLSDIAEKSSKIKQCKVDQVMPGECESLFQPSIMLTLQCAKKGATKQQINSAILKGESSVSGEPLESPYHKIKKKITGTPYFLTPEKENFIVYSKKCSDYKDKLFRISAQTIKDGQAKFIVTPLKPTTCFPTTNLDKKYPVLSPQQLKNFTDGIYLENHPTAERPYEFIEVMIANSLKDAGQFFSKMKKRVRLTINTKPYNSEVTIVGMKRPYKKGMKLNVGLYKIRVTSPTYYPLEKVVKLNEGHSVFDLKLKSSIEKVSCFGNKQPFLLDFKNKYYLKKINNCTYQVLNGGEGSAPFKLLVIKNHHPSKHLINTQLEISHYGSDGEVMTKQVEEISPRLSKINSGSSGISDVPEMLRKQDLMKIQDKEFRLTILNATFSL